MYMYVCVCIELSIYVSAHQRRRTAGKRTVAALLPPVLIERRRTRSGHILSLDQEPRHFPNPAYIRVFCVLFSPTLSLQNTSPDGCLAVRLSRPHELNRCLPLHSNPNLHFIPEMNELQLVIAFYFEHKTHPISNQTPIRKFHHYFHKLKFSFSIHIFT